MKQDVIDCMRIRQIDRKGRSLYVVVSDFEVICSIPSDARDSNDLLSASTALTRVISVALQGGINMGIIKKQLRESSKNKNDLPDLIHRSIEKFEEER